MGKCWHSSGVAKLGRTDSEAYTFAALADTGSDISLMNGSVIEFIDLGSIGNCRLSVCDVKRVDSIAYRVSVCLRETDFPMWRAAAVVRPLRRPLRSRP